MKISEIEIFQLGQEAEKGSSLWASNMIVLRLTTSDGYVGYGEAVPTLRNLTVIEALREVARVYKGKDPFDVERNRWEWFKHDFYLKRSFESTTALSAFDIASWDIIGKVLGTPIFRLLGGEFREKVKTYANGWYSDCVTPEQFAEKAKEVVRKGYKALKFDPFGAYFDYITEKGLKDAEERVKAVRETVGEEVEILIEHHGRFNPNSAIMIAKTLEKYNPLFMEEPVHPENIEGLRKYRESTSLRIALGERIISKEEAIIYVKEKLVDFLQPDITNIGGVTELKKLNGIAEAFGIEMAFHNAFGPIQNAVTIQMDASLPNFLIQESFYDFFPNWKRELVFDQTPVINGYYSVPRKPGIGVDVNEKVLEKYRISGMEYFNPEEPLWVVKNTWKNIR